MKSFSIRLEHRCSQVLFPDSIHTYDTLNVPEDEKLSKGNSEKKDLERKAPEDIETKVSETEVSETDVSEKSTPAVVIFDENTVQLFPQSKHPHYVLPPGEQFKNSETLLKIAEWALSVGASRDTTFIAVGGGVVCDITAFVASMYMRGVPLILVPTTLLSMVDASLGGKTGIDFAGYKNILGSFYPAREVRVFPEVLQSLPKKEYASGLAEVIKQALLRDPALLELLQHRKKEIEKRSPELLSELIYRSQIVKKWYIEQDPYEKDVRGHLNLGHTFGHALEAVSGLGEWSHGEAVAWGIGRAMLLGRILEITPRGYANKVFSLLKLYGYTLEAGDKDAEGIAAAMEKDKKKKQGKIRFILQKDLCETVYHTVDRNTLLKSLVAPIPS